MCERWAGPAAHVGDFGGTDNRSSAGLLEVECPIVKNNQLPDRVSFVTVHVADSNASQDVNCSLWAARRIPGDFVSTKTADRHSTGSIGGEQPLLLGALTPPPPTSGAGSTTWFIYCTLPPNTSVLNYFVAEPSS